MPRIRTIKPEFFRHEKLQDLHSENPSLNVMLVYAGLWTQCDMNGVFVWQPRQMKLDILPFIEYDMCAVLDLLTAHGFIKKFSANGKEYGHIPTFLNNQHIPTKEKQQGARYPAYDEAKEVPIQGETRAKTRALPPAIGAKEREREREREKEKEREGNFCSEPQSVSPPTEKIFLTFLLTGKDNPEFAVTEKMVDEFAGYYPAVDVRQEIRNIAAWCISNPSKRKTKAGAMKFLNAWLSREQDKPHNNFTTKGQNNGQHRQHKPPITTETLAPYAESWARKIEEQRARREMANSQ